MIIEGIAKAILEKYAEPLALKVVKNTKDEWEKFKIDSDIAFTQYLKNAY